MAQVTCGACYGTGKAHQVLSAGEDNQGIPWAVRADCPSCVGRGTIIVEDPEPGDTFAARWRMLWLQTFPGIDEGYKHLWDEDLPPHKS